jgi:hypothetical protein
MQSLNSLLNLTNTDLLIKAWNFGTFRLPIYLTVFSNNNMTISFNWDVTPVAGFILPGRFGKNSFKIPADYY